ncbi:MAG: helix-turn-helix domain-containing protein [Bacilli bacterium]|nr:helix-turn-helix domain-containing protein [Bacilli bacterium]
MATIRIIKNKDYSVISNYHLKDKNLSFKAKGLLSFMLSLPDDWNYSIKGISSLSKESEKTVRTILKELESKKYLIIEKKQNTKGHFIYEYFIYEKPGTQNP